MHRACHARRSWVQTPPKPPQRGCSSNGKGVIRGAHPERTMKMWVQIPPSPLRGRGRDSSPALSLDGASKAPLVLCMRRGGCPPPSPLQIVGVQLLPRATRRAQRLDALPTGTVVPGMCVDEWLRGDTYHWSAAFRGDPRFIITCINQSSFITK